jgi:ABC-type branched-subunit amino acid transport system substrate-binding protein
MRSWQPPAQQTPVGGGVPPASSGAAGALVQSLGPGTLLKSGRYRLLHRFHPAAVPLPQGDEPPLMVASDMELPSQRVLVQELLLTSVWGEDADRVRRLIAQRFEALARDGGVAPLVDHFSEHHRHFLVFELPSGDLLLDRLQRAHGPMEETTAIGYVLQVLDVLATFERQQPPFVHGNLCPANIVLRPSGQAVLVGCSATLLMYPDGIVERSAAGGVPGYAAPEQARGQASSRSDLYSLCAVLHHAVTGVAPSARATAMYQPARRLNPQVSLEVEEVLGHGLRPASTQRFQSAAELRAALQPLASGRMLTRIPDELTGTTGRAAPALAPVRDARGRLVLPRQRASQNPLVLLGMLLLLIMLVGGGVLYMVSPHPTVSTGSANATPNDLAALFQSKGIALSGGEFIFDTQRHDNALKQRGSLALASGDERTALADFQSAVSSDPADAEAAIYSADLQLALSKQPYVTIVAAVAFAQNADIAAARAELQGVFLAQQRINAVDLLPGGLRVRVLVLNSGQVPDDATTASNLLLNVIQNGNAQHLMGIVGWPESAQTRLAISALAPTGLAIVSPTADDDGLGGAAGHFFPMVPSISQQAAQLADAAVTQLFARRILVLGDPADATSNAMATRFLARINAQYAVQGVVATRANFTTGVTTDFDSLVKVAQSQYDSLIFVAGSDQDAIYLAQAVSRSGQGIRVLVDSRAYTPALFGLGSDPVATLAQNNAAALAALDVVVPAVADEWQLAGVNHAGPAFFDDYTSQFETNVDSSGMPAPDPTSILSYDATQILGAAVGRAITVATTGAVQIPTPTQVRDWLLEFNTSHPFLGVGGAVVYSATGSVPDKALAIVKLVPVPTPAQGAPVATTQLVAITGGTINFCGGVETNCGIT